MCEETDAFQKRDTITHHPATHQFNTNTSHPSCFHTSRSHSPPPPPHHQHHSHTAQQYTLLTVKGLGLLLKARVAEGLLERNTLHQEALTQTTTNHLQAISSSVCGGDAAQQHGTAHNMGSGSLCALSCSGASPPPPPKSLPTHAHHTQSSTADPLLPPCLPLFPLSLSPFSLLTFLTAYLSHSSPLFLSPFSCPPS